jgi:hypothetical protein
MEHKMYFNTKFDEFIYYYDLINLSLEKNVSNDSYESILALIEPLETEIDKTMLNTNSVEQTNIYLENLASTFLKKVSYSCELIDKKNHDTITETSDYVWQQFMISLNITNTFIGILKRKFYLNNLDFELIANEILGAKSFEKPNKYFNLGNLIRNTKDIEIKEPEPPIEKLKWIGTTAQFGFIINELATKGFIEFPQTHKELSISKLAKLCLNSFNIDTTKGTLENALNPEKPQYLPETKCKSFAIPNINDLK